MIIQPTNLNNQPAQPDFRVNEGAPRVVADSPTQGVAQQASPQQLKNAVNSVNEALQQSNQNLEISVDSNTQQAIVKLVDSKTGELIRQIPTKEMLAIAQSIDQFLMNGQLLSDKV